MVLFSLLKKTKVEEQKPTGYSISCSVKKLIVYVLMITEIESPILQRLLVETEILLLFEMVLCSI